MNTDTCLATRRDHYLGLHEGSPLPDACDLCDSAPRCIDCHARPSLWCHVRCRECLDAHNAEIVRLHGDPMLPYAERTCADPVSEAYRLEMVEAVKEWQR